MKFQTTDIPGVLVVEPERYRDERGYFARTWCRDEIAAQGMDPTVAQMNTGFSHRAGTLRGMHFQRDSHAEIKFVRCTRGALYDVALDLRPDSPTYRRWFGVELTAENGTMLWIPEGCAHGYQTLVDDSELLYLTSKSYAPDRAAGARYDDPAFGIDWPLEVSVISNADRAWPDFGA
jgi:dTDP-4-dehydrorhamnose 3,5-epimerase